ncbi:hypothetical protein HPP92_000962 [Vanilla planifolia]|uniref:Protein kinase domain-containing protein n=1 Tax=Vanilla planifolia TaxID=51239 RepID=A0A835VKY2_VANPL|nr:hypothetical protein HPP92_000962 [Vanilla planifolia]
MAGFTLRWRLAILTLLVCWAAELCAAVTEEGRALLRFRDKVEVDPYGALADWHEAGVADPCSWFGVECADGRVVALNLNDLLLRGMLAPELGKLIHMKYLNLHNNSFSGIIPPELGGLQELQVLDLGHNYLSGLLPPDLGSILSLEFIVIEGNRLVDGIPWHMNKLLVLSQKYVDGDKSCSQRRLCTRSDRNGIIRRLLEMDGKKKGRLNDVDKAHRSSPAPVAHPPLPRQLKHQSGQSLPPLSSQTQPPSASPLGSTISLPIFFPPSINVDVPASQPSLSSNHSPSPRQSPSPTSEAPAFVPYPSTNLTTLPPSVFLPLNSLNFPTEGPSPVGGTSREKHRSSRIMLISVMGGVSFLLVLTIFFCFWCRTNKVVTVRPWSTGLSGQLQKAFVIGLPALKRSEIQTACEDFSNIIGSLPNCKIYKGTLSSGVEIAVLSIQIDSSKDWSKQCESEFRMKISRLSKVNHKNFVNLLGYCEEEEPFTRMMVFEYAPNGTLFEHLHVKEAEHLDWAARLRIAMGIAYCLDHMLQLNPPVVIENIKSSTIYLTDDYAAKVSDLDFSREFGETSSPPHPSQVSKLDQKKTVYQFGLLLIEILSGRIPSTKDDILLENLASCCHNGEKPPKNMMDPTLTSFNEDDVGELWEVIQSCINPNLHDRPTMSEISGRLKCITEVSPDRAIPTISPLWWAELEIISSEAN